MNLYFETKIQCPFLEVKSHFNLKLFKALKPPFVKMNVVRFDGCSPGNEIILDLSTIGKNQKWVSVITQEMQDDKEWFFIDEGKVIPWPLASWKHTHRVRSLDDQSSLIIDDIHFECVHPSLNIFMYMALWPSFAIRPKRYKRFFEGIENESLNR